MSEPLEAGDGHGGSGGHELRDVTYRPIVLASVGLAVVLIAVTIAMRLLFQHYVAREATTSPPANPLAAEYGRAEPPEPHLQSAPVDDLRKLRESESAALGSYGWVDRENGIVRIPIERAMDLLMDRGLPTRKSEQEGG